MNTRGHPVSTTARWVLIALMLAWTLVPIAWMVLSSFTTSPAFQT